MLKICVCAVFIFITTGLGFGYAEVPDTEPAEPIVKQHDFTGQVISITVVIHSSYDDLNKAFDTFYNIKVAPNAVGWFGYVDGVCQIHVLDLKSVNKDYGMFIWGHELAHCMYGLYHK